MKTTFGIVLVALAISPAAFAANIPLDARIDQAYKACQDKAVSTVDMSACYDQAINSWDKELNRQYTLLIKDQPKDVVTGLKQAQRDWLRYRDSYLKAMIAFYSKQEGTIWGLVYSERKLGVIRDKAIDLNGLNNSIHME